MTFGDILKELLEDSDITQKQLATDLNIAATTIGNYVRGIRQPDFETLKLFAAYFNVTTDYLLDCHNDKAADHTEDYLLHIYRSLTDEQKKIYLEQGKAFVRSNIRKKS